MGGDLQIEQQDQWEAAEEICVQANVLNRCDVCGEVTSMANPLTDVELAYRRGNTLMSRHDPLTEVFNGERRLMTDTIKEVFESAPDQCSHLASYERQMEKDD